MDHPGGDFFADSRLSQQQYGGVRLGRGRYEFDESMRVGKILDVDHACSDLLSVAAFGADCGAGNGGNLGPHPLGYGAMSSWRIFLKRWPGFSTDGTVAGSSQHLESAEDSPSSGGSGRPFERLKP